MRAWFDLYRSRIVLIAARTATVILLGGAGAAVAGHYHFGLLPAVAGATVGAVLGMLGDTAAVAHGRRLEAARQTEVLREAAWVTRSAASLVREHVARHNTARSTPGHTRGPRTGTGAAPLRPTSGAAVAVLTAPELTQETGEAPALLDEATAVGQLCGLMLAELRPADLIGQQGRGVIQLAADLGPKVPQLDPETVVAYVSDHVLVAAGQTPEAPQRWHGALDRVSALPARPSIGQVADLLGIERAAGGRPVEPVLDLIVSCIAGSSTGLGLGQLGVALAAHDCQLSPYTLAVLVKHLVDEGRLRVPAGSCRYRRTPAPVPVQGRTRPRPPLNLVYGVLSTGPAGGMTARAVALEVIIRRDRPCTPAAAERALRTLVSAHRATYDASSQQYLAVQHPGLLSGPGLTERIRSALQHPYDGDSGLTPAELTERVDADGFGAGETRVRQTADKLIRRGDLVMTDGRYQIAPF